MVNGLIIVSPNPNDKIFMVDGLSPGEHGNKILEYLYNNELDFEGCDQEMGYTLACYIAKLNYLVDTDLGEKIYESQYQWFRHNKRELRYTAGVIVVSENNIKHYDSYTLEGAVKPFTILRDFIEERRVSDKYVSNVRN